MCVCVWVGGQEEALTLLLVVTSMGPSIVFLFVFQCFLPTSVFVSHFLCDLFRCSPIEVRTGSSSKSIIFYFFHTGPQNVVRPFSFFPTILSIFVMISI